MNEEKLESNKSKDKLSGAELQDLVIESDAGARSPNGIFSKIIVYVALAWSIFQLWISSPLPFMLADATWLHDYLPFNYNLLIINDTKARYIHLSFALFLAYLAYPAFKSSPRQFIPLIDKIFAVLSAFCALYLLIFYKELSLRSGMPNNVMSDIMSNSYEHTGIFATVKRLILDDVILSILGIILLLEATRRALGPPLMIIGLILLLYTHFGASESIPDILRHKGHSLEKIASHQWLTSEGIFGIALGVSTSFVFLFVLFGALLDKAGAGNYFIKVAFSLLGHLKGGPAKAAVLSSGLTGLVSGSSIANVVTTGTFTVPLMRRVGFSKEKAGAVEVASSVNGQIMPPVMGAAAFLMVEYVAIPYTQVVKHAFIPALISYIALIYIVHLEAVKNNMQTLSKPIISTVSQKIFTFTIITSSLIIVAFISYTVIAGFSICMGCDESIEILNYTIIDNGFIGFERISGNMHFYILGLKQIFGQNSVYYISLIILLIYVLVIRYESKMPDLLDNADDAMTVLPETGKTVKAGLHYLLPIVVLVWCLIVERLSPGFSAFWATTLIIFILLTQDILKSFFRSEGKYLDSFKNSFVNLLDGLVTGARNMVGIGVATAAAGIVVGSVSLTGIGQVLTEVIEYASGGYILIILILTAFICLILGMGLPTTANYIVVASLMANVIVELGMQNGLLVPLIAVHLFVFYFGIMADVTPPVGLASFAAAAVSGGNPIRTGLQAFVYSLRTIILPFFFIFNTEIILYNVDSIWHAGMVLIVSTIAILLFTSGTQGYFIVKNKFYESLILILVSFLLFIPNKFIDLIYPPFEKQPITQSIEEMNNIIGALESGQNLKLYVNGKNTLGQDKEITLNLSKETKEQNFSTIVRDFGLIISTLDNKIIIDDVIFNSPAQNAGVDIDLSYDIDFIYEINEISFEAIQPNVRLVYIPALLLMIIIFALQKSRSKKLIKE